MLLRQQLGLTNHTHLLLMTASTGFVLLAFLAITQRRSFFRWAMLIGLVLCWLGDFVGARDFRASLVAFLLAHIAFIVAFAQSGIQRKKALVAMGSIACADVLVGMWLFPHVPSPETLFIAAYMLVISAMVVAAFGRSNGHGNALICTGATLFFLSDIIVARWKFVDPSPINGYLCYPLYYAACVLLAWSALNHQCMKCDVNREAAP